jgi:hypothetical protein
MVSKVLSFNVKLMTGDIYPVTFSSQIKKKDLKRIIEDMFPDMGPYYEAYWFYEHHDLDFNFKEEPPFPKNGELVYAIARPKLPTILFVDCWNCYDITYHRWYHDYSVVINFNNQDVIHVDFRYRKTEQGEFFFKQDDDNIHYIDESFSGNATRIVQFNRIVEYVTKLSELLLPAYLETKIPQSVYEVWIMETERKWNEEYASCIKTKPDVEEQYDWENL